ncbi:MAG TPA: NAD(P)/FAD-dependent oxidoreductase, partial [Anseongella sp.]
MKESKKFDAIIIGGSYAGLSAAMSLGRSLRRVLIIDSGKPCNRQTPHSHNFITQDGVKPGDINELAKRQVLEYDTVKFMDDLAVSGYKSQNGFHVKTKSGKEFSGNKLIVATGVADVLPDIRGFSACWGISIIHCPYCHGYEFRGLKTAIMADANKVMHLAPLVNNLTDDLTVIVSNNARKDDFKNEDLQKLADHHIEIIDTPVREFEHKNGQLRNVIFSDGKKIPFDGLYAAVPFKQHSEIPAELGCKLTEEGHIELDFFQTTSVAGV